MIRLASSDTTSEFILEFFLIVRYGNFISEITWKILLSK